MAHLRHCSHPTVPGSIILAVIVIVTLLLLTRVDGLPIPAPNFTNCDNWEGCCPPPYNGTIKVFNFSSSLPMRTRKAAHLVDDAYVAQYRKAYALLRALPDSDPRSWINQANLHCAYCDDAFGLSNSDYPLEVHYSWIFFPWHRFYLYFHERILAKLLGDDTFALPFWNWDNQSAYPPYGNILPYIYANATYGVNNTASSLYDPNRNQCSQPPNLLDLDYSGGCDNTSNPATLRAQNNNLMYTQLVTGSTTPSLFFGQPYRLGDPGGTGGGTLESAPHGPVHMWAGTDENGINPYADMGLLNTAAQDPLFFSHHANIDRLWTVWKTLPGGNRSDIRDPDYLNTQFLFYDENASLVVVNISQALSTHDLMYTYQNVSNSWVNYGNTSGTVQTSTVATAKQCSKTTSPNQVDAMIAATPSLSNNSTTVNTFSSEPFSFRVPRPPANKTGEEVLILEGLQVNWTKPARFDGFVFFNQATVSTSISCPEFIGSFSNVPHSGMKASAAKTWRAALGMKLHNLGKTSYSNVVVTLVPRGSPVSIRFTTARIQYES